MMKNKTGEIGVRSFDVSCWHKVENSRLKNTDDLPSMHPTDCINIKSNFDCDTAHFKWNESQKSKPRSFQPSLAGNPS